MLPAPVALACLALALACAPDPAGPAPAALEPARPAPDPGAPDPGAPDPGAPDPGAPDRGAADRGAAGAPAQDPGAELGPAPFRGPGPRFAARRLRALAARPEHLLAGDLDGDGRADLLACSEGEGPLFFWAGGPRGLAAEPRALAADGWALRPVLLPGPVDPGPLEPGPSGPRSSAASAAFRPTPGRVAIASRAARTLALHDLANGGATVLWRAAPGEGTPRALAVGDLEADGALDLALVTDRPELVLVGGGRLERLPLEGRLPRCACVLAGGAGVAIGFQDTRAVDVVARAGRRAALELGFIPRALLELDLDGDGDLELAVLGGEATLRVFGLGRGGGAEAWLDPARRAPRDLTTAAIPLAAEAADLDGDGLPELLAISAYGLRYEVFAAGPDGPLRRAAGYAGQTPRGLACGDFDGDGRVDLALANQGARSIGLLFGDGRGGFDDAQQVAVGATPNALAVADVDGDGRRELAVLCAKDLALALLAPAGGAFERSLAMRTGPSPRALTAVDWDGDGRAELAWLAQDKQRTWITVASLAPPGARTLAEIVPGRGGADLLACALDGRAALFVADDVDGALVWVGPDDGGAGPRRLAWPDGAPQALCALQLDGDPEPELAVALGAPGPRRGVALVDLIRGADGARAAVELGFAPTAGWPLDVAALTLGAGGPGIAVLTKRDPRTPEGALELLLASGEGGAYRAVQALPAGANPQHLAVGDVDGDGADEVFVAAQNDHRVHAFRLRRGPEPASAFELEALDALGAHLGCLDALLADVDGDGALELLVANGFSDDVSVIRPQAPR